MAYTTINKHTDHFNIKLYTGTGSSNAQTGVGFQPDFLWIKNRNGTQRHNILDSIRGVTKRISSNTADAEATNSYMLSSFDSDGFTLGTDSDSYGTNTNGSTYVAWNWKANGAGSSNTDGDITSTVSANTTAGFSIVKFTGTGANNTVGHGLGVKPNVIILKSYENGQQWSSYWSALGATKYMRFNTTGSEQTASNRWNNTEPTTSVFTVSTDGEVNTNGQNQIAYCFAEKPGYSKFGKYTGNGNSNGTFIYTGFKPSWVIIKNISTSNDWFMIDNSRDTLSPNNPVGRKSLFSNTNGAEVTRTTKDMDFLSNGIKLRTADGTQNNNNENYIYMAFGQSLVGSNNVPCTAR